MVHFGFAHLNVVLTIGQLIGPFGANPHDLIDVPRIDQRHHPFGNAGFSVAQGGQQFNGVEHQGGGEFGGDGEVGVGVVMDDFDVGKGQDTATHGTLQAKESFAVFFDEEDGRGGGGGGGGL